MHLNLRYFPTASGSSLDTAELKKALHYREVVSLELCNLRRIWYQPISEFRFAARINIAKKGRWERDDPNNQHNSNISI